MNRLLIFAILFLSSGHLIAETDVFIVASKVTVDSKLIGSPVVLLKAGEETKMVIEDIFELSLLVTQAEGGTVLVAADLTIDGETVSPNIMVEPGQEFGMGIGETVISMTVRQQSQDGI